MNNVSVVNISNGPSQASALDAAGTGGFEEFYLAQFQSAVRLATAITGSKAAAEDVTQDAFAKLYPRFRGVTAPEAYLRRSIVNGCVSRFRKHRREDLTAELEDHSTHDATAARLDLERRLAALPPRQRAAVVLRVQLGLSEQETADAIGCRAGTVGSLLHRALATLRIDMENDNANP